MYCILCQSDHHKTLDRVCPKRLQTPLKNITPFKGRQDVLSNFYPCTVELHGRQFRSSEHAYQFLKAKCYGKDQLAENISKQSSAYYAKRLAKNVHTDEGWDRVKVDVMRDILLAKEKSVPEYRQKLLDTANTIIVKQFLEIRFGLVDYLRSR